MLLNIIEILVLTVINSGSIFLIIVLLANSLNDRLYRWLTFMTISMVVWVNFAYLGYIDANPAASLLFYRINGAAVSIFFFAEYMFYIDSFLEIRKRFLKWLMLAISLIFAVLILFTDGVIAGVTWQRSWNEIAFGPGNDLFSMLALVVNIAVVALLIRKYFKLDVIEKRKVLYFLVGTFLFIFSNIAFNVVSPELLGTARFQHLGDYSAVLFLLFTAYAILRRKFMNLKIALTAFLIGIIGMLVMVDIFALSHSLLEQAVKFGLLILFVVISVLLVRSVLSEIRQRELLKQLAQEQKDIIDVMGHEIRTPLTVIVQELKLHERVTLPTQKDWEEGKVDSEKVRLVFDSLRTMSIASSQAVAVVNDMLETARIDKGSFELNYADFDLVEEVNTSIALTKKTVEGKNVTVNAELPDKLEVNADRVRIREAVDALLSNAVKYGKNPETGNVDITVAISQAAGSVEIEVKDHGIGISPEDIEKLGQKFVRLNPKTSNFERPGGTGLGLFVVKGIAERHGGNLRVESEGIGKGSSFTIVLPAKQ